MAGQKEQFYGVITAHAAAIFHEALNMDLVLGNGEVVQIWRSERLLWEKENEPQ